MRALTFGGIGTIRHETVADPRVVDDGDAIVQVEHAGLCGSDLHVYHGREAGLDTGTVMGHEFVGRVVDVGRAVRAHATGTRVVAPFSTCCGACFYCARGISARCLRGELFGWVQAGRGLHGGQAELVRVPHADASLVAVDDLAPELALLLADVVPTGWHLARLGGVQAGDTVVVLGCGPIGLAAVVAAREHGAGRVFAVDAVAERRELARRLGAESLALGEPVAAAVAEATQGRGADAVLEAVGSPPALRLAFELVRMAGTIGIAGVHHEKEFVISPVEAYDRNLSLRIGRASARSLMDEVLPVLQRRPELGAIVTHRRTLAEGAAAYRMFDGKTDGCIKVMFEP